MKVFSKVQDPYLRHELRRLNDYSKGLLIANLIFVFIPTAIMYWAIPDGGALSTWVRLAVLILGLVFSSVIYTLARGHPTIHGFMNSTHLFCAVVLVLLFIVFGVVFQYQKDWDKTVELILLGITPIVLSLVHVITFSIQCADNWKFARDVATGTAQWNVLQAPRQIVAQPVYQPQTQMVPVQPQTVVQPRVL